MPLVCGVKFRGTGKVYYFSPGDIEDLQVNDYVVVETVRGRELGRVTMANRQVGDGEIVGELKPILRHATTADLLDACRFRRRESEAIPLCEEQVARFGLPMKIVSAEYNYDGARLTFLFTSEQRVDFRGLVRELARTFRTRIELRQIGVRDEAKIVGGMGKCGRPICCATWLTGFCPVSIRAAKQQNLPLSPMEISGLCGRLLCCLAYENHYYKEVAGRFPKVGRRIETPCGSGKVVRVSVLTETVTVLLEDGSTVELTAEQLSGKAPITPERGPGAAGKAKRRVEDAGRRARIPARPRPSQARGGAGESKATAEPSGSSEPARRRRERPRAKARTGQSQDRSRRREEQSREVEQAPVRAAGRAGRSRRSSGQGARRGGRRQQRQHTGQPGSGAGNPQSGPPKKRDHSSSGETD